MTRLFWVFLVSLVLALTFESYSQTFIEGFESGSIGDEWRKEGSTTSVSTEHTLEGKYAFRAYLTAKKYSNARSELRFNGGNGVPKWQAFFQTWGTSVAIYIPEDFIPDNTSREMIIQFHGTPDQHDTYKSPSLAVYLDGSQISTRIRWVKRDPGTPDDQETYSEYFGTVTPGQWHYFVLDIHWDHRANGDGFAKIYFKKGSPPSANNLAVDYNGPLGSPDEYGPYPKIGVYKWDWKVEENVAKSKADGVTHRELFYDNVTYQKGAILTGKSTNTPPVVDAGSGKTISLPTDMVALEGDARDPDGSISSIQWRKVSGGTAYIETPNKEGTKVSNLQEGTYTFEIKATDNEGASSTDRVNVTVLPEDQNESPRADAGPDKTITLPTNRVQLNGSGTDPDGTITSYTWKKMSGGNAVIVSPNTASTEITNLEEGEYVFRLVVRDDQGDAHSDNVTVTVLPGAANQRPLVYAGKDQNITLPENEVEVEGTASDPDGNVARVLWTKNQGGEATILNPESLYTKITGLQAGTYTFRLTARDNIGETSSDNVTVTVLPEPNELPVVDAGDDITITLPENMVTVAASASDADGTIRSIQWTKIAGGQADIASPATLTTEIRNLEAGTYTFRITVIDDKDGEFSDELKVNVLAETALTAPVVSAGQDQTIQLPRNAVELQGNATDADGNIESVNWTQVSGNEATIVSPNTYLTEITGLAEGTYVFQLEATDNDGLTGSAQVTVNVHAGNLPPVVNAGGDISLNLPLDYHELTAEAYDPDGEIVSYEWIQDKGKELILTGSTSPVLRLEELGVGNYTFRIVVTDDQGAQAEDVVRIRTSLDMNKVAGIPRVFSPDGNGIDDYWIFDDASITEGCNIVIFNRQGRNVYEASSYANDWDGTYNGSPLPEGDYYYVINCEDEEKPLTGGVRILRQ